MSTGDDRSSSGSLCATPCELSGPGFCATVELIGDNSAKFLGKEAGGAVRSRLGRTDFEYLSLEGRAFGGAGGKRKSPTSWVDGSDDLERSVGRLADPIVLLLWR